MRRTYFNKIVCFVFATILTVTSVFVVPASAASADEVADKIIISRIEELERQFSNQYFTVNQKGCRYWESGHGCPNCFNSTIMNQSWFVNKANSLSWVNNFDFNRVTPTTFYGKEFSYTSQGWSCHGHATTSFALLFDDVNNGGRIDVYNAGTYSFNYSSMYGKVLPGDFVRLNSTHSAIVISVQSNGLEVLDCNSNYTGYNCYVRRRIIPFSAYSTITITRSVNRAKVHTCSYNDAGKCSCGTTYNFNASKDEYSYTGEYKRKIFSSGTLIKATPYSVGSIVGTSGKNVRILYSVKNHFGNTWLAVQYETSTTCEIGYVYSKSFMEKYNIIKGTSPTPPANTKPKITTASGYKSGNYTMDLSWSSENCVRFEVSYKKSDGTFVKDSDYVSGSSFTSKNIVRDMTYKIVGYGANSEASEPYYITVKY